MLEEELCLKNGDALTLHEMQEFELSESVYVDALICNADLHMYLCAPHGFACPVCHVLTAAGQPGSSLAEASVPLPTLVLLYHVGLSANVSVRGQVDVPRTGAMVRAAKGCTLVTLLKQMPFSELPDL